MIDIVLGQLLPPCDCCLRSVCCAKSWIGIAKDCSLLVSSDERRKKTNSETSSSSPSSPVTALSSFSVSVLIQCGFPLYVIGRQLGIFPSLLEIIIWIPIWIDACPLQRRDLLLEIMIWSCLLCCFPSRFICCLALSVMSMLWTGLLIQLPDAYDHLLMCCEDDEKESDNYEDDGADEGGQKRLTPQQEQAQAERKKIRKLALQELKEFRKDWNISPLAFCVAVVSFVMLYLFGSSSLYCSYNLDFAVAMTVMTLLVSFCEVADVPWSKHYRLLGILGWLYLLVINTGVIFGIRDSAMEDELDSLLEQQQQQEEDEKKASRKQDGSPQAHHQSAVHLEAKAKRQQLLKQRLMEEVKFPQHLVVLGAILFLFLSEHWLRIPVQFIWGLLWCTGNLLHVAGSTHVESNPLRLLSVRMDYHRALTRLRRSSTRNDVNDSHRVSPLDNNHNIVSSSERAADDLSGGHGVKNKRKERRNRVVGDHHHDDEEEEKYGAAGGNRSSDVVSSIFQHAHHCALWLLSQSEQCMSVIIPMVKLQMMKWIAFTSRTILGTSRSGQLEHRHEDWAARLVCIGTMIMIDIFVYVCVPSAVVYIVYRMLVYLSAALFLNNQTVSFPVAVVFGALPTFVDVMVVQNVDVHGFLYLLMVIHCTIVLFTDACVAYLSCPSDRWLFSTVGDGAHLRSGASASPMGAGGYGSFSSSPSGKRHGPKRGGPKRIR